MTALLSFLCSEPLLSSCHSRRYSCTSENEYLIDSNSWDSPEMPNKSISNASINKGQYSTKEQPKLRHPRFKRLISFVNSLNPLKLSKDEESQYEVPKQKMPNSQTVSFAAITPSSSMCNPAMIDDDDYSIRHFAVVEIIPGSQPLFISDARYSDRNKWFDKKNAQSFDIALRRRRSLSQARMTRRAFSLNKMELDANARRCAYSRQHASRRPESAFIDINTYQRPMFYAFDEDANLDSNDLYTLEWNHPARAAFLESQFYEATTPPIPPKPKSFRRGSPISQTYVNEIKPPPRPKKLN